MHVRPGTGQIAIFSAAAIIFGFGLLVAPTIMANGSPAMPQQVQDGEKRDQRPAAERYSPDRFFASSPDTTRRATRAEELSLAEGFQAELLYTMPIEQQGSWVCLTSAPDGSLIASAQRGNLYRITPPPLKGTPETIRVEPVPLDIGSAQGMCYAFGSLYVVVSAEGESGLYRLRDTNGNDELDSVELLRRFDGDSEHGPHGVIPGPDGRSLFIVGGNGSYPSPPPERSLVPLHWHEDRLLQRIGASDGEFGAAQPGAWVCRTDPDGRSFDLVAMGLRNPYDIAFNTDGELFTFDSDMEWDAGTPWYRPTRVCHVTSGADFGWRAGTSKWPDDYIDSLGSVVDVGFSSPTGLTFGTGAHFPDRYQSALFIGDWSLGNIYAVHLRARGASYVAELERFATAVPLPVTDIVIHPRDGALYFTIGGRGLTSALYRITHTGMAPTEPRAAMPDPGLAARQLRRRLESLHQEAGAGAIDFAWPHLGDEDRVIRYAARVAVEHQPSSSWRDRVLAESVPRRLIAGTVALARVGDRSVAPRLVRALQRIDWNSLSHGDRIDLVRAYMLILCRFGKRDRNLRQQILAALDSRFPSQNVRLDRDLAELLTYLDAPDIVARLLAELTRVETQEQQIHYAVCLRQAAHGWNMDRRRTYLEWFRASGGLRGGFSFPEYMEQIWRDATQQLKEAERIEFKELLGKPPEAEPDAELRRRELVKHWTVGDLLPLLAQDTQRHDAERGRRVFAAALCYRCHRVAGQGGMVGPDLTGVTRRFTKRDLLEAILEPGREVSNQYRTVQIALKDGRLFTGKVRDLSGNTLLLMTEPLNPADLTMLARDQIDEMRSSSVSIMPEQLLDSFTADEILDLLAFLDAVGVSQQ